MTVGGARRATMAHAHHISTAQSQRLSDRVCHDGQSVSVSARGYARMYGCMHTWMEKEQRARHTVFSFVICAFVFLCMARVPPRRTGRSAEPEGRGWVEARGRHAGVPCGAPAASTSAHGVGGCQGYDVRASAGPLSAVAVS